MKTKEQIEEIRAVLEKRFTEIMLKKIILNENFTIKEEQELIEYVAQIKIINKILK